MKENKTQHHAGFSLIELMISMAIMLSLLAIVSAIVSQSLGIRNRESRKTDALTSAQAALNIMSREIANSGFGLWDSALTKNGNNGIVVADSNGQRIHFRANINNVGPGPVNPSCTAVCTSDPGEDITYFFDAATDSIVRYDRNDDPQTSVVVNTISNVTFEYIDYVSGSSVASAPSSTPSANTGRMTITVTVALAPVAGQPNGQTVVFKSEINLRNSNYMLHQY